MAERPTNVMRDSKTTNTRRTANPKFAIRRRINDRSRRWNPLVGWNRLAGQSTQCRLTGDSDLHVDPLIPNNRPTPIRESQIANQRRNRIAQ